MSGPSGANSSRNFCFLVNPASGGGAAPEAVVPVAALLRAAGAGVEVTYSPAPSAARSLVQEAVGRGDVVVSVGGDGMLSSLVAHVADHDGILAIVPAGRGNDFARMTCTPTEAAEQAEMLLHTPVRRVDLIEVQGFAERRVVAGSVYAGVDARAAAYVAKMKLVPRSLQYPLAAVRSLATYTPAHCRLVLDGIEYEFNAATVVIANSGYYGNGMKIAPSAVLDDGLLDVVVIEAASKRELIRSLPKVYDGSHVELSEVSLLRGTRAELSVDGACPVSVGGDGEPLGVLDQGHAGPITIDVLPSALNLVSGPW